MIRFPNRFFILNTALVMLSGAWSCSTEDSTRSAAAGLCGGDCTCSGLSCTCAPGGTCTIPQEMDLAGTDGSPDAAAPGADGGLPDGVTFNCASKNHCDLSCGTGCTSLCAGQSMCNGTCGADCTSRCEGKSHCLLDAGVNASVTCGGASNCAVALGTGSTVSCEGNSTCFVACPEGGCSLACTGSSSCTVECGGTTACNIECNGQRMAECAPGMTCSDVCSRDGGTSVPTPDGAAPDGATPG